MNIDLSADDEQRLEQLFEDVLKSVLPRNLALVHSLVIGFLDDEPITILTEKKRERLRSKIPEVLRSLDVDELLHALRGAHPEALLECAVTPGPLGQYRAPAPAARGDAAARRPGGAGG